MTVNPGWTDDRVATLKDLWALGHSAGAIADVLKVTRNTVIGKIDRLKLTRERGPRVVSRPRKTEPKPERTALPVSARPERRTTYNTTRLQAAVNGHDPGLPEHLEELSDGEGVSLFDLTNATCRWPKGTPGHEDFCFCGVERADLIAGKPYCPAHTRMARRI